MKQIFLILSIVPFLFGCVQTREQRGAEIAKSEMMKRLYDADSYEPIETHIDSAYTSIYTDLAVIRAAHDLIELNAEEKKERLQRQYNSAKSSAAIWSDSRGWSSYAREEYRQAKEELDDVEYPVLEYFPHTMVFLPLTDKKPPAEAPPLRNGIVAVRPSRSTP